MCYNCKLYIKGRVRSKLNFLMWKVWHSGAFCALINQSKSVTLLRGKRNKEKMSLSTSDCWIFASDGGYLKIRDTSDWKRQVYCTGTSGSRVVIPTVRSASSSSDQCYHDSQNLIPLQWSFLFKSDESLIFVLPLSESKIHRSEVERDFFSLILSRMSNFW